MTNINLEISNPCNEKCIHCYRTCEETRYGFLSESQVSDVLHQAKQLGTQSVLITGGEPLLNKSWKQIIQIADNLDFRILLFTNGSLMTESDADFIQSVKHLKEVQFSVYSLNPQTHDSVTRLKGSCEKTKNAIDMLRKRNVPIFLSCPTMKTNLLDIQNLLRWADENNINSCADIDIFGTSDYLGTNLDFQLDNDDFNWLFDKTMENNGSLSYLWGYSIPKNLNEILFYGAATDSLLVSGDGNIYPMIGWYEKLGNIATDKLKDVFENNELLKKIRQIHACDIEECVNCEATDYCVFCPNTHLTANHGQLYKLNKQYCEFVKMRKHFANKRDKILKTKD